jgi:thiol-disulfide isomerase/thioredoxin
MVERINRSISDSVLSEKAKSYFTNECKLIYLKGILLSYHDYISLNYRNFTRNLKKEGEPDTLVLKEPARSYYAFLKDFNLNDPEYLYNNTYKEVLKSILSIKTLNIPAINDMPVQEWLVEVKKIMADLIGSDKGLFYDMLIANAYARQFNDELKPLTDKQKENISTYYKDEEIGKILLKRNEEIIKLVEERNYFKTFANQTPIVPKEALMNAILSKYKGKAVVVDFWATWCGPCMNAIKEIRPIKSELHDKPITFVYITNGSSPMELWKKNIKMIGGEQYYLKDDEWKYVMEKFGFNYIPSYLFYDKKGVLKNKVTTYPGTEKMRKMLADLLE